MNPGGRQTRNPTCGCTVRDGPPIILYDYQTTRAGKHPARFLKDFKGYLHVDGYDGYNGMSDITLVGCWTHYPVNLPRHLKPCLQHRMNATHTIAHEGLEFCNRLFSIERELHDATPEKRYEGRLKQSQPMLDAFKDWLKYQTPRVLPKSALRMAIQYCRNQWDKLVSFMKDGRLELDNNRADTVIDSLERLSRKERVIGLISHVPELHSRIARRLIVDPPIN